MSDFAILPECYIDTNLIETIVPTKLGYNHQKGCGTVTRLMQGKLKDKFAVGIVDKDKNELKYSEEFDEKICIADLQLFKHKNPEIHHYLIFIKPAIEMWIIKNTEDAGMSLLDFGLPKDLKELKKITKKTTSKQDLIFKKLFVEMKKSEIKSVEILAFWITYLKENQYNADINDLVEFSKGKYS